MSKERKQSTEAAVREIRRKTRRKFAPEEKIRIVLEGLRGEQSISELLAELSRAIVTKLREIDQAPSEAEDAGEMATP